MGLLLQDWDLMVKTTMVIEREWTMHGTSGRQVLKISGRFGLGRATACEFTPKS